MTRLPRHDGNQAMDVLAVHLSRLNIGINKLQELNIDTTLSSLPKYAVVGDQSAGKSSIVQALCGIALPRSSGTTTRCPFLITTHKDSSSTGAWRCKVSIKKQDYHDIKLEEQCDTSKSHITHFVTISDPNKLEDTLKRAQLAILDPGDDPKDYVDIDLTENPTNNCLVLKEHHLP